MKIEQPAFLFDVILTTQDGKTKEYQTTEPPWTSGGWIHLPYYTRKTLETEQGIEKIEYNISACASS